MTTAAPARPHTDAVAAAISAAGLAVGRGVPPAGAGWQGEPDRSDFVPYAVLFPNPGIPDGNIADPLEYLDYTVQVTVVAASQEGAEAAIDTVKDALVGRRLTVIGRAPSYPGQMLVDRPAARDDAVAPPLHYAIAQIRFRTQPA